MSSTTIATTLQESVNIILANQGESPVNSIVGTVPQQVSLALNTIEEVSSDVQGKGWWYNQSDSYDSNTGVADGTFAPSNDITIFASNPSNAGQWSAAIPEQARRYITIRAARIMQSRMISSEELQKFSYQEELVSLAILQQAHVRNSNGVLSFSSLPSELKGLGIDDVMFLQGSVEEKLGNIKLTVDLANKAKIDAETALLTAQELKVDADASLTAEQELKTVEDKKLVIAQELKIDAEASLIAEQELKLVEDKKLVTAQELKVDAETALLAEQELKLAQDKAKVTAEASLIAEQELKLVEDKKLVTAQELKIDAETSLLAEQELKLVEDKKLVTAQELKVDADTSITAEQELKLVQDKAKVVAEASLIAEQELKLVQDKAQVVAQSSLIAEQELKLVQDKAKTVAEASLIAEQELKLVEDKKLVTAQELKVDAETSLIAEQELKLVEDKKLVTAQELKVDAEKLLVDKQAADVATDTLVKTKQKELLGQQKLTEVQNTIKVTADAGLVTEQQALIIKQALDVAADTLVKASQKSLIDQQVSESEANVSNITADAALKGKQGLLADSQKSLNQKLSLTEVQNAFRIAAEKGLITSQQALTAKQTLDVAADTTLKGLQGTLLTAQATDVGADTTLKGLQGTLVTAQATDVGADTTLKGVQASLVEAQELDVTADKNLKVKQGKVVDAQQLDVIADTALKTSQKVQLDALTAIEATAEKEFYDGVVDGSQNTYRNFSAEMRMMGIQETAFHNFKAYKKLELLVDARKLRFSTATETGTATELIEVNKVMRFIGESPVAGFQTSSLASECVRLLRDTDKELQGRGWWFNTETDVELNQVTTSVISGTPAPITTSFVLTGTGSTAMDKTYVFHASSGEYRAMGGSFEFFVQTIGFAQFWGFRDSNAATDYPIATSSTLTATTQDPWTANWSTGTGGVVTNATFASPNTTYEDVTSIPIASDMLSVEANDYDAIVKTVSGSRLLYDLKTKLTSTFSSKVKAKVIYQRALIDTPSKYLEYLNVRVAILLTELYPQSGVDIQRLPKMEAELRAYFKDLEFDEANYSVFDNPDTANRIGINRNYSIL